MYTLFSCYTTSMQTVREWEKEYEPTRIGSCYTIMHFRTCKDFYTAYYDCGVVSCLKLHPVMYRNEHSFCSSHVTRWKCSATFRDSKKRLHARSNYTIEVSTHGISYMPIIHVDHHSTELKVMYGCTRKSLPTL